MRQTGGVLVAAVLWTAGYALWVVTVTTDSSDPSWLSILVWWLWGLIVFGSIGSSLERMTDPRAGAWNGAAIGFLLVLFLAVPATIFAIADDSPPSGGGLLAWLVAWVTISGLGAAAGALGGWVIQTDRTRRRRAEAKRLRPRLRVDE